MTSSEEVYVASISAMISLYMRNAQLDHMLNAQEASVIFSNAEEILSINTKLLGKLQAKGEPIAKLARVFLEVGPFFDIYLRYCYGYEPGLKVLQARRQQSDEVDQWFEQQRCETKVNNQPVESFLIMPVQRLLKYPLFFRELLELVGQAHPARDTLEKAARLMFDISTSVNEQMGSGMSSLAPLLERLTPYRDLVALLPAAQERKLLCEFSCTLAEAPAEGDAAPTLKKGGLAVSGYVLSDLLLLCKAGGKEGKEGEQAEIRPFLLEPIEEIQISWPEYPGAPRCSSFPFPAKAKPPSPSVASLLLRNLPGQEPAQAQAQAQAQGQEEPPSLAELRVHASGEAWLLSLPSASELARLQKQLNLACSEIAEHPTRTLAHAVGGSDAEEEEEEAHAMAHAALASVQRRLREKRLKRSSDQSSAAAELLQSAAAAAAAAVGLGSYKVLSGADVPSGVGRPRRSRAFSLPISFGTKDSYHDCSVSRCSDHAAVVVRLVDWDTAQDTVSPDYASFFVCTDEGKERSSGAGGGGSGRAYKAYPREQAQLHIARPWVAYDRSATEVASGGIGFGRGAIRRDCQPFLASYFASQQHQASSCNPSVAVFGGVLSSLVKRPDSRDGVPAVVQLLCARLLEGDSAELKEMRIFRVTGDAAEVATVAAAVNRGGDVPELVAGCSSAHTVASLLKKFFRELSLPLCTFVMYAELLALAATMGEVSAEVSSAEVQAGAPALETLRATLARLPPEFHAMLGRLMSLLRLVAMLPSLHGNKMSLRALAAVWGPNLLRPQVETSEQLKDIVHVVNLTAVMIRHVDYLFDAPVPLGREVGEATAALVKKTWSLRRKKISGEGTSNEDDLAHKRTSALKLKAVALKWHGLPGVSRRRASL